MNNWNEIFAAQGKVFNEPHADMPGFADRLTQIQANRVLDLGCGSGRHLIYLLKRGFEMYGFDQSPNGLALTREWLLQENLSADLRQGSFYDPLPYPAAFFDGILSTQAIHHARIADIRRAAQEIARITRPGGLLFLVVPSKNPKFDPNKIKQIEPDTFIPLDGDEAGLPHHLFNPQSLAETFAGFEAIDLHPDHRSHHVFTARRKES